MFIKAVEESLKKERIMNIIIAAYARMILDLGKPQYSSAFTIL